MVHRLLGVAVVLAGSVAAAGVEEGGAADRIWWGGPILTMNDGAMRVEAVAERGGRIVAAGARAEVERLKGPETKVFDLGGRAMLPGFVDAHGHVMMGGIQALSANLLAAPDGKVSDIASLQETLRAWVAANQKTVQEIDLIIGFGYDNSMLKEKRHPTRADLDAVSKDVPILTVHQSGHLYAVNSKALEVCGINADTQNPAGGLIRREADGKTPNGVLEETAGFPVVWKLLSRIGAERAPRLVVEGSKLWARFGYTTAQEGRAAPTTFAILKRAAEAGDLKIDVAAYPDVLVDRDFIKKNLSNRYEKRLRVAGAKLTIDGSVQGFTAWRDRPYFDPVGDYAPGYTGYASATPEAVRDAVEWAYANDVQIITHANGEAAIDLLLACVNAAQAKHAGALGGDPRSVLIHGQLCREDQVDTMKRLGMIPSLFSMHTFYWGDWHRDHSVGPMVADNISPTGWCARRGMVFTVHHDAPVAFPDSMRVLDSTVTRRTRSNDILGPWQRVDVITALKAMTIWPARQHFEEASKGSIEAGKLADFVVLSKDPTAVDPDTIDQIKVVETIKEGVTVFALTAEEAARAELMIRPGVDGSSAFENFLVAAAARSDIEAAEAQGRAFARFGASGGPAGGPHDKACVLRVMDRVMASVAGSGAAEGGR